MVFEGCQFHQSDGKHKDAAFTRHIIDKNNQLTEFV